MCWHQYAVKVAVVHRGKTSEHGHYQAMSGHFQDASLLWLVKELGVDMFRDSAVWIQDTAARLFEQ